MPAGGTFVKKLVFLLGCSGRSKASLGSMLVSLWRKKWVNCLPPVSSVKPYFSAPVSSMKHYFLPQVSSVKHYFLPPVSSVRHYFCPHFPAWCITWLRMCSCRTALELDSVTLQSRTIYVNFLFQIVWYWTAYRMPSKEKPLSTYKTKKVGCLVCNSNGGNSFK